MPPFGFKLLPGFLSRRPARAACVVSQRTLGVFETLESRELLAADMAEVTGFVRVDLQGDGNTSNDVAAVGAQARLYRDGGNGTFDDGSGDDQQVQSAQTVDSSGRYHFNGLGAGRYFVQIALPDDLQFASASQGVKELTISAAEAEGTLGRTIDGFTTNQRVEASPPLPKSQDGSLVDSAVLGGERDLFVELTEGFDPFTQVALTSGGGLLRLASDSDITGNAKIVWDGTDGNARGVNPTGLGGLDLTQHNGNTMTGISLTSGADHANSVIRLKVYSDADNWSEFVTTAPETPGGKATLQATFNFSDPQVAKSGVGADFASVGALELTFEGVTAVDGQVSLVGVVGRTTKTLDFIAAPRLSLGDLVWSDINNNGFADAGERGIDGVKINLYADVDDNNQFTAGSDRLVGTTQTSGGGRYLFEDLAPGKYLAVVDAMNFQSGMALDGLRSSTGNDAATDPDDDVDNDDDGTAMSDLGVVSQAICLAGRDEPINDGDMDHDSNRTLDFGFFGFDLVLDKDVDVGDGSAVAPEQALVYTITVRNDGPSIAKSVQFTDELPAGVVFTSVSSSKPSSDLHHSGGVISGGLGDMANGDVVTISVRGAVSAAATGVLVNQARVVSDHEIFLGNNADRVENSITPKIDLSIKKEVDLSTASPGQHLHYTLDVTNHGPSTATGVTVVDDLPATGVTYVGASLTPTQKRDKQLTFDLGTLSQGATRQIEVEVAIEPSFVGTLVNDSRVDANEAETRMDNNVDDAQTVVAPLPTSVSGYVYVDRDDDGKFDDNETPISGVNMTLMGVDITGKSVTETTTTNASGFYIFRDLTPGEYIVKETHPTRYKDGKDAPGDNGDGLSTQSDGRTAPDFNDFDEFDADALEGIVLVGGNHGIDYNFGELAVGVSKINFIRSANW